jgi:hypothetical protein
MFTSPQEKFALGLTIYYTQNDIGHWTLLPQSAEMETGTSHFYPKGGQPVIITEPSIFQKAMHYALIIAIAIAGAISAGVLFYSFGVTLAQGPAAGASSINNTIITPLSQIGTILTPTLFPSNDSKTTSGPMLVVVITQPAEGSTVKGEIEAVAKVSGDVEVEMVEGYLNDTFIDTEVSAPYEFTIPTTQFADGNYKLRANAIGDNGVNATAEVSITIQNLVDLPPPGSNPTPEPKPDARD